ncbi:MAG TPA: PAS domain S-box protein, partial [Ohtaekwangia sp.]
MTSTGPTEVFNLPDAELFSAIVDSMGDAIWVIDLEKSRPYWYASEINRKKYGVPEEPVPSDFWRNNIHPEDTSRAVTGFERALKNPDVSFFEHEYRFLGTDKVSYVIRDTIRFLRDKQGHAKRVVGTWRDVTQDRLKEAKLEELFHSLDEERKRFRTIAELSNTAIWEIDHITEQVQWMAGNKTMTEFGFDNPKFSLYDWVNNIHEEDRERVLQNFERAKQSESVFFDSYRFIKKDKSIAYIIDQGTFFRNSEGKAIKSFGSWIDITRERKREIVLEQTIEQQRALNNELRQRESKLAKAELELHQINDQLSVNLQQLQEREFILNQSQKLAKIGSWDYDTTQKQMFWSNEMYNIYGVDHSFQISDLNEIYRLFDQPSGELVKGAFQNILINYEVPFDVTARLNTPLGYKKWLRITAYPIIYDGMLQRIAGLTYDITYFKESEERLKTSEEKFANAFRNNPDLVTILREEDSMIVDANDKSEAVLGYSRQELIGKLAHELKFFVHTEDRERFFAEYFANGKMEIECPWFCKDGKIILVLISSTRLEIEGARYILSVIRDVSETRWAEERFRKAFDLNPDLMLIFRERDRVLVEVNGKLDNYAGYTREEVLGRSTTEFNLWAIADDRDLYYKTLELQDHVTLESTFLIKGGQSFLGIISAQRIKLHGESHLLVIVRDITERKRIEQNLQQSEANLNATVNNTKFLVWSVDRNWNVIIFNQPFAECIADLYGIQVMRGERLVPDDTSNTEAVLFHTRWTERYQRAITGESFTLEEEKGGRYFRYSLGPILGKDIITGVTVFGEDITERKKIEERILENEAKLDAIINNTDLSIWSVDTSFRITALNTVLKRFTLERFSASYEVGDNFITASKGKLPDEMILYWVNLYKRAFTGESILDEFRMGDSYFQNSVHPIIENKKVVGASVYTRDISELKKQTAELIEANKKIGDLKLMALRSVMNPHFIFNALNSIQYFIAKNDRQNAINYLSTFSKLIRGVLNHSVHDKISLIDELDLLKYYINLEMVRFENKFDFKLTIDPELDLENIEIPS